MPWEGRTRELTEDKGRYKGEQEEEEDRADRDDEQKAIISSLFPRFSSSSSSSASFLLLPRVCLSSSSRSLSFLPVLFSGREEEEQEIRGCLCFAVTRSNRTPTGNRQSRCVPRKEKEGERERRVSEEEDREERWLAVEGRMKRRK